MFSFNISPAFAWLLVVGAGAFEIIWAVGLRSSEGLTKFWPSVITLAAMGASVVLLGLSLKAIPLGTAYAVWVGIGVLGTVIFGVVLLGEPLNALRIVGILLLLAGIIALKLA